MKEPRKEDYGWYESKGPEDEPSGWEIEGGEKAYNEALGKYHRLEAEGIIKGQSSQEAFLKAKEAMNKFAEAADAMGIKFPIGSDKTLKALKDSDLTGGWMKAAEDIKRAHIPGEDYFKDRYVMGTDIADIPTFILIKRTGNINEVIMEGQIRDKVAFEEVVQNLSRYFNAARLDTKG